MKNLAIPVVYPKVPRGDHEDILHGRVVKDPYRWLEDLSSAETQKFICDQNECTENVLAQLPYRKEVSESMRKMHDYEKCSCPMKRAGKVFYYMKSSIESKFVVYAQDSSDDEPLILLDPSTFSTMGAAALAISALSEGLKNELYYAYAISHGGSDWQTIYVMSLHDGRRDLDDCIEWVKFSSIAWMHDDSGFFYSRFPAPVGLGKSDPIDVNTERGKETDSNINHQIWFHKLNTPQSDDTLIYAYPEDPECYLAAEVSVDGKFLLIYIRRGCKNANMLYVADLESFSEWVMSKASPMIPVKRLIGTMDDAFDYVLNRGTEFYFQTNFNAPQNRLVKGDIADDDVCWMEIIPQQIGSDVIESVHAAYDRYLVVKLLIDVKDVLRVYDYQGNMMRELEFPSIGTMAVSARYGQSELFVKFVSFLYPGTIFCFDLATPLSELQSSVVRTAKVQNFCPEDFEARQEFYKSKDGTRIPMFIVGKKDLKRDGANPVYLYGYGGFNVSVKASFCVLQLAFIKHFGGILAIANIRGGGEYGEIWHQMGTYDKKQNVFDDFHAAAEYLIREKYTSPAKLVIQGGSNGGLLVAVCCNQRPDLYRCGVATFGVMDMLRFHKFTCGHGWTTDFGDPDVAGDFEYIRKYSPLHNVPVGCENYPAMMLTTGDHDDRVVPLHCFKHIAELQYHFGGLSRSRTVSPLLARIETRTGHGAGRATYKLIEEYADMCTFIAWCLQQPYTD